MKALFSIPAVFSLSALFLTTTPVFAKDDHDHAHAEIGKPAPDFTLAGADGKSHSLAEAKGKIVVLEWTNPGCPFVQKFYQPGEMQKLQKEMKEKGVVWYRVNSAAPGMEGAQTAEQAATYEKAHKIEAVTTLLDPEGDVGHIYGARTTPHIFIINAEGTLVYNGGIDDMPTPRSGDIAIAKNYVRQTIGELLDGKPVSISTSKPYGCGVKYKKK